MQSQKPFQLHINTWVESQQIEMAIFLCSYTQVLYVPLSTLTIQAGRQQKIRIPNLLIACVPICARTTRSQLVDGTLAHLPTLPQSSDSGATHLTYIIYKMHTTFKSLYTFKPS